MRLQWVLELASSFKDLKSKTKDPPPTLAAFSVRGGAMQLRTQRQPPPENKTKNQDDAVKQREENGVRQWREGGGGVVEGARQSGSSSEERLHVPGQQSRGWERTRECPLAWLLLPEPQV